MGSGYVKMDKDKTASLNNIVAILSKKGKGDRSRIIFKKESYLSKTSSKKLAERLEGGEKPKRRFRKSR